VQLLAPHEPLDLAHRFAPADGAAQERRQAQGGAIAAETISWGVGRQDGQ